MATMHIELSDAAARMIEQKVGERHLAQAGTYIEELVQADFASGHERRINAALREALASDPKDDIELTPEWWAAKRSRLTATLANGAQP